MICLDHMDHDLEIPTTDSSVVGTSCNKFVLVEHAPVCQVLSCKLYIIIKKLISTAGNGKMVYPIVSNRSV